MTTMQKLISTTIGRRVRGFLSSSATTTPIPDWDSSSPVDLPQPDIGPVLDMIRERVAAHAAAGTLDEAHGDLLDRVIRPICRQWSEETRHAYEEQLRLWNYLEEQGTAHSIEKGQELARLNIELSRYQAEERRVWARFDDGTVTAADFGGASASTPDPLPAPPVPRAAVIGPTTDIFSLPLPGDPHGADDNSNATKDDNDDKSPRIHSV